MRGEPKRVKAGSDKAQRVFRYQLAGNFTFSDWFDYLLKLEPINNQDQEWEIIISPSPPCSLNPSPWGIGERLFHQVSARIEGVVFLSPYHQGLSSQPEQTYTPGFL
ncbi:MAG: hypothetical protein ABIK90_07370 [candidate division WOR-3 bacterium]